MEDVSECMIHVVWAEALTTSIGYLCGVAVAFAVAWFLALFFSE